MKALSLFGLTLTFLLLNSEATYSLTPEQSELIDSLVDLFRVGNYVPGVMLTIVQDGVSVIEKGYGKKNIDDDLDVDPNTLFAIGSVTKV